jgi:hypothetical protein
LRGALVKIGALGIGSRFSDVDAEEVAHLLFAEGIQRVFATHPPLIERIKELDPGFQPSEFETARRRMNEERAMVEEETARTSPEAAVRLGGLLEGAVVLTPAAVSQLVANPGTEHVVQAQEMLESLPASFQRAARDPRQATRSSSRLTRCRRRRAPARLHPSAIRRRFQRRGQGDAGRSRCLDGSACMPIAAGVASLNQLARGSASAPRA